MENAEVQWRNQEFQCLTVWSVFSQTWLAAAPPVSDAFLQCHLSTVPARGGVWFSTPWNVGGPLTTLTNRIWWYCASFAQSPLVAQHTSCLLGASYHVSQAAMLNLLYSKGYELQGSSWRMRQWDQGVLRHQTGEWKSHVGSRTLSLGHPSWCHVECR